MFKTPEKIRRYKMKYQKSEKGREKHNEAHARWKKQHNTTRRHKNKLKAVDYKGGQCGRCRYAKCLWALEFHHINPDDKTVEVGEMLNRGYGWGAIKKELDKCILLCANCHRELHAPNLREQHGTHDTRLRRPVHGGL